MFNLFQASKKQSQALVIYRSSVVMIFVGTLELSVYQDRM